MMKVDGRVLKDSLELRYAEGRGYHVRAKQRLVAGSVVLEEKPCAVALSDSAAKDQCRACLMTLPPKLREEPIKCTKCEQAWYCSQRCMKADSRPHGSSGECHLLQDTASLKELGTFVREACLALRLLQCKRGEPPFQSNWDKFIGPQGGDDAHVLCIAAKAVGRSAKAAADAEAAGAAVRDEKACAEAVCQVFTNALEVLPSIPVACACDAQSIHTGQPAVAMYSLISRLNHSCRANTAYHFKAGGAVVVRAVVDIEPDEELCISYLDPIQPLPRRQEDLQKRFCFTCTCERCTMEQQLLNSPADSNPEDRLDGAGGQDSRDTSVACLPTWFLSAVAPRVPELDCCLTIMTREAEEQYLRQGDGALAWKFLEIGILQAVKAGVHPYHHRCLGLYACLASACRVCAKAGAGRVALRRAAMYTLLQAGAAEAVLAVGEYGAMPHAARTWSEAGGLLCEVLATELAQLEHAAVRETTPLSGSIQENVQSTAQEQSQPHFQQNAGGAEPAEAVESTRADRERGLHDTAGQKRGAPHSAGESLEGENGSHFAKRARVAGASNEGGEERRLGAVQWPDVLQAGSGRAEAGNEGDSRKAVPEPPTEFAAGVCAAWAALCAASEPAAEQLQRDSMPGGDIEQSGVSVATEEPNERVGHRQAASAPRPWQEPCPDMRALAGPAGFLSCSQPPSPNQELRVALQKELNAIGRAEKELQSLEHIGIGAIMCVAHATSLLKVTMGYAHPTSEANMFCAFFAGLPYSVASVISRTASQLSC